MSGQLFQVWGSFHYDKNAKTRDAHIIRIRPVAVLLGYGEPQILDVFKNTLHNRLFWVLFPILSWLGSWSTARITPKPDLVPKNKYAEQEQEQEFVYLEPGQRHA